jgi:hypothetical protein
MAPQIPLANGGRQALAWQVRPDGIRVHNGGTGGFSSAVLVDQGRGRAVAMLVNSGLGYSTALGRAGLLALAGDDPRPARPQPPGRTAPARSSGCCSTGGPRTSTPSGRPRSRPTCPQSE